MVNGGGNMTNNIWCKTILTAYNNLEKMTEAIDKLVDKRAINSFYMGSSYFSINNISYVADKIIELTDRKIRLINLKFIVDSVLKQCDAKHTEILIEKYMDNDKAQEIAQRHNLSMRTYFRRLVSAENEFLSYLSVMGYDDKKLSQYISTEKWINQIYRKFLMQESEDCSEIAS